MMVYTSIETVGQAFGRHWARGARRRVGQPFGLSRKERIRRRTDLDPG
jgi:hypothetical protein